MKTKVMAAVICGLLGLAVLAQTQGTNQRLTDDPVFKKDCAGCHGKTAGGRHFGGPSLKSEKAAGMSAEDLKNIITSGKGRMPKYGSKLKPEEIETLAKEVAGLNGE